nr:palindromic element RPE1 domain-containing protein [Legionella norrlandica]
MGNRLLSKLAAMREVRGETERRTAVYTLVHEDSSTVSTKQFSMAVEFRKKSNDNLGCC